MPEANLVAFTSFCTLPPWPQGLDPKQAASPSLSQSLIAGGVQAGQVLQEDRVSAVKSPWVLFGRLLASLLGWPRAPPPATSRLQGWGLSWEPQRSVFPREVIVPVGKTSQGWRRRGREERLEP